MHMDNSYIYLDNQSTTKVDKRVLSSMRPYLINNFGNPSTDSIIGLTAKNALNNSREQVASLIKCNVDEIYFTSGATEAINWAIRGIAEKAAPNKNHIIISSIEHSAVLKTCEFLERFYHFRITKIKPQVNGIINPDDIKKSIKASTLLVAIQHANNEIGTIQPVKEIGKICRENGAIFFVDAAQSVGKINCDVTLMQIDLLSASGHKLYAPKGIGFLYINSHIKHRINPLLYGGGQEEDFRSGTQNVPYIVGLGEACKICHQTMENEARFIMSLRNEFIEIIHSKIPEIIINGSIENRLPGNVNFSIPGITNSILIRNVKGIIISKGSACNSSKNVQSYVLQSISQDESVINSAVRIGIGRNNTRDEILFAANEIISTVNEIKQSIAQF